MDDILQKVHEAGLTLKAGCGIGYEFSTLRPKGAYVSGAGAYTSGPLSFMDIYDRMCFTVSSAGGRRGAQMATFDIGHPDVLDFIRVKQEDGRLRQFNLSLLMDRGFMAALSSDEEWPLSFPLTPTERDEGGIDLDDPDQVVWREWPIRDEYISDDEGRVACRIYRKVRARQIWDVIMTSTYNFAEPGFILIDQINEMNNNWFCENIRATNPCGGAAAAGLRSLPARFGEPHPLRPGSLHRPGAIRLERLPGDGGDLHPDAGQRGRAAWTPARASTRKRYKASAGTGWAFWASVPPSPSSASATAAGSPWTLPSR